jgi:hypothetical protein
MIKTAGLLLLLSGALSPRIERSCTLVIAPLTRFEFEEFVFVASVRGYLEDKDIPGVDGQASALIVEVTDTVYFPSDRQFATLYPFGYNAMCGRTGFQKSELGRRYPVGSYLYIVARHLDILSTSTKDSLILETRMIAGTLLTRISDKLAYSDSKTELNYERYRKKTSGILEKLKDSDPYRLYETIQTYEYLPYFEIRKDLLRLHRADSEAKRISILTRLARSRLYAPIPLKEMIINYISDEKEKNKLIKKYVKA